MRPNNEKIKDMRVLGRASSSNVQALMWGCAELGVTVKRLDFGETFGGLDTPDFLQKNPQGKIPVLELPNGGAIFETPAILRFLASEYGKVSFWPVNSEKRAYVDMWAEWAKHEIAEAFTGPIFWRVVRTPKQKLKMAEIRNAVNYFENQLAIAEPRLESGYLCGEDFTLADIQFAHVLFRYFEIDLERSSFPNLQIYYEKISQRLAFQRHVMRDYEELRNTI